MRLKCYALVVDDDKEIRIECEKYLKSKEDLFSNIILAADGVEATQKLSNQEFALIVLDVNMPKKGAFQILAQFPEIAKNTVIISGGLGEVAVKKAVHLGIKYFLVKPFDEESFFDRVNRIIKPVPKKG